MTARRCLSDRRREGALGKEVKLVLIIVAVSLVVTYAFNAYQNQQSS